MSDPVQAVELHRVAFPLVHEHRAAHGTEAVRDLVLVRVELAGGAVGWGECSALSHPTYTAEYTAGAWALLRDELVPALLGGSLAPIVGHPMARAALATALADAVLRRAGVALADELAAASGLDEAPGPRRALARTAVIGRPAPSATGAEAVEAALAAARRALAGGAVLVKLKATADAADVALVADVAAELGGGVVAVDFNGTATPEAMRRLDGLGLAYVEQPAPAEALVRSAHLADLVDAPVALDESLTSLGALEAAVALRAGTVANVKPARCGSPHAAASLAARAVDAGMDVFVGGLLESGVGRAAALAVAALPACTLPTDLGPSAAYVAEDLTAPLVLDEDGRILVPDGPGIGREPDPDRLRERTSDHLRLEP